MYDTRLSCGEIERPDEDVSEEIRVAAKDQDNGNATSRYHQMNAVGAEFTPHFGGPSSSAQDREFRKLCESNSSRTHHQHRGCHLMLSVTACYRKGSLYRTSLLLLDSRREFFPGIYTDAI